MVIFETISVFVILVAILAIAGYVLYLCSPLPRRRSPFRDSVTGERLWPSPQLDDHQRNIDWLTGRQLER